MCGNPAPVSKTVVIVILSKVSLVFFFFLMFIWLNIHFYSTYLNSYVMYKGLRFFLHIGLSAIPQISSAQFVNITQLLTHSVNPGFLCGAVSMFMWTWQSQHIMTNQDIFEQNIQLCIHTKLRCLCYTFLRSVQHFPFPTRLQPICHC